PLSPIAGGCIFTGKRMVKKRVAVQISGRGSNMAALIEAAKERSYPAEIALVVSNRPDAAGGAAPGGGAEPPGGGGPPSRRKRSGGLRARAASSPRSTSRGTRVSWRLHAPIDARLRAALGGSHAQHPPLPLAVVPRSRSARPSSQGGSEDLGCDGSLRRPAGRRRPDHRAGSRARTRRRYPRNACSAGSQRRASIVSARASAL